MRVGDATMRDGKISIDVSERKVSSSERATPPGGAASSTRANEEGPSPFARILSGLGREVDRGETLVRRATSGAASGAGKEMSSMDLIALQAGVYRYSEAVDLSAKLVDRAASGVKTVLQGQ